MECTTCGWDYMWWRNDESLTYPIVSPICTSVFFKSDDIFIYRDIDGDKRDELTYDEMMNARGSKSLLPDSQLFIRVSKEERTQFGNIFIEKINMFHEDCGKVCTKYYPYYFCENCKVQFEVSSREDIFAIYKVALDNSSNSVKTSKLETFYRPL
jgi:hypothetical protein